MERDIEKSFTIAVFFVYTIHLKASDQATIYIGISYRFPLEQEVHALTLIEFMGASCMVYELSTFPPHAPKLNSKVTCLGI